MLIGALVMIVIIAELQRHAECSISGGRGSASIGEFKYRRSNSGSQDGWLQWQHCAIVMVSEGSGF